MADLTLFKRYLESEDIPSVRQFLAECDRAGANEDLRQAGKFFGVPTVEVEGVRYLQGRDLARLGYGCQDTGRLRQLLKKYGRGLLSLAGFDEDHQSLIRQAFSLSPGDSNATLATLDQVQGRLWGDLLLAGMKGETEAARKVMAYLPGSGPGQALEAEQGARGKGTSERLTDLSDNRLLRCAVIPKDDPILRSSLRVMRDIQNIVILRARQVEAEEALRRLQAERQGELLISPEQERVLLQMIDRLANYRVSPERPYARVYLGIRNWLRARVGFTFFRGIVRKQFPLAQSLLAEAIRREEAAQEQEGLCLVKEEKDEQ